MHVVIVSVSVVAGREEEFLAATLENARNTRGEPGNVRFDVVRCEEAGKFVLYEVYRDVAGQKAHQQTGHYLAWKAAVEGMMAGPRVSVKGEWVGGAAGE